MHAGGTMMMMMGQQSMGMMGPDMMMGQSHPHAKVVRYNNSSRYLNINFFFSMDILFTVNAVLLCSLTIKAVFSW